MCVIADSGATCQRRKSSAGRRRQPRWMKKVQPNMPKKRQQWHQQAQTIWLLLHLNLPQIWIIVLKIRALIIWCMSVAGTTVIGSLRTLPTALITVFKNLMAMYTSTLQTFLHKVRYCRILDVSFTVQISKTRIWQCHGSWGARWRSG